MIATYAANAMRRPLRLLCTLLGCAAVAASGPAFAQKADAAPKPDTYLCPDNRGGAVDCFLQAVDHLYTMCRQVKSIEIIEFGYAKSDEGVNGAKSEYCVDKHKQSILRPYQAAVREAGGSRAVLDGLRALHELWLKALAELRWKPGEDDAQYKLRVAKPYDDFREGAKLVRAAVPAGKATTTAAAQAPAKSAH